MMGLPRKMRILLLAAVVLLSCACSLAAPSSPVPASTPSATSTVAPPPTRTSVPTLTPFPTRTPLPAFEAWPTSTPYVLPSRSRTFAAPDLGVTLKYPHGWAAVEEEDESSTLVWFVNATEDVFADLMMFPVSPDETLESSASDMRDIFLAQLQGVQVAQDERVQLDSGQEAWSVVLTGAWPDGAFATLRFVIAIRGGRMYVVRAYAAVASYNQHADDIDALVNSLTLSVPAVYGIPREQVFVTSGGESDNPREYDPATTRGSGDKLIFSGLVSFDREMGLVPDLAESWQVKDGVHYTFTLRAYARFHDGRPVTAHDVVYSWERAADPELASDTVLTYLGDIVGVKEARTGEADHIAGLKVIDDHTLQVTIDGPKPYFLHKLTMPVAYVVDQANVESGPEWYRTPNGTGPYRLTRWDSYEVKLYERNQYYHLEQPAIPYVVQKLYAGVGLRLYEMGEIDVTSVGTWNVPRILDPDDPLSEDLRSDVSLCTSFIVFDVEQPPFDDPQLRRAFSMAFDRQQYIDVLMDGLHLPAQGLYPPGLPGYNGDLAGLPYDPEGARRALAESSYGSAEALPPIVYTASGIGNSSWGTTAALAEMWQRNLGVTITVENLEPDRYRDQIDAGNHGQVFSGGWCADYADPGNFADVLFHSDSLQNEGHYSNPALDELLERAQVEPDVAQRLAMYQEAERMIVQDAPVLFTVHSQRHVLVKPHIKGYVLTPVGVPMARFLSIDASRLE